MLFLTGFGKVQKTLIMLDRDYIILFNVVSNFVCRYVIQLAKDWCFDSTVCSSCLIFSRTLLSISLIFSSMAFTRFSIIENICTCFELNKRARFYEFIIISL